MNKLLALWIRLLPGELARVLVGVIGPSLRGLKLNVTELVGILGFVSTKIQGGTPVYTVVGTYGILDVEDIVTGISNSLMPLFTDLGMVLTSAQFSTMADKLAIRLGERYPKLLAVLAIPTVTAKVNTAFVAVTPVTGSGGLAPLGWALVGPAGPPTVLLPAGMSLAPVTGLLSGTPTVIQATTLYTVQVRDAQGQAATQTFSLTVTA